MQDLLLTTHRLLNFSTSTFALLWNWGPLVQLLKFDDICIRYITVLCLGKVYGLSDTQTKTLLTSIVGSLDKSEEPIYANIEGNRIDIRFLR